MASLVSHIASDCCCPAFACVPPGTGIRNKAATVSHGAFPAYSGFGYPHSNRRYKRREVGYSGSFVEENETTTCSGMASEVTYKNYERTETYDVKNVTVYSPTLTALGYEGTMSGTERRWSSWGTCSNSPGAEPLPVYLSSQIDWSVTANPAGTNFEGTRRERRWDNTGAQTMDETTPFTRPFPSIGGAVTPVSATRAENNYTGLYQGITFFTQYSDELTPEFIEELLDDLLDSATWFEGGLNISWMYLPAANNPTGDNDPSTVAGTTWSKTLSQVRFSSSVAPSFGRVMYQWVVDPSSNPPPSLPDINTPWYEGWVEKDIP